jgi:predicted metalloprotease with PDZ domain
MATCLGVKTVGAMRELWDIRQPVRTLAENTVKICYQETTSEDIEDFMRAAVTGICRVCKPVRLL